MIQGGTKIVCLGHTDNNFVLYAPNNYFFLFFTKEAQEKENSVKKDQEKPEKKTHKYRGR